ncbi:adenylate kinase family protein [Candidatus Bathyarchaeota archaeon]|nr:adenylate kinase family protein [Candidatus Bathyarchaeota archaeon]
MVFPRIIVVTGTPGVGKTVCSRLLAGELSARHIELGELVEGENLTLGEDSKRGSAIADLDRLRSTLSAVIGDSPQDCVVEGHLAPLVLDGSLVELAYVLRCDPDELLLRLGERGFSELKVIENAASEILGVCLWEAIDGFGEGKVVEIDTTSRSPEYVVNEMVSILDGRSERVVGEIDWLSMVSEQGRLTYFFR